MRWCRSSWRRQCAASVATVSSSSRTLRTRTRSASSTATGTTTARSTMTSRGRRRSRWPACSLRCESPAPSCRKTGYCSRGRARRRSVSRSCA
uniref:Putative secreted protein n=1 Tax=Anopheles triannulatus TaxID=58253 RepID=A0A2M4B1D9_9DIPT